ncbi:MAG: type II secretion system protein, partial [Planctomycetaceae bacterium]
MARQSRAFTLIELLVVIAIIALLMAILMPALSRAKEQARDTACRGNVKSIGIGLLMYLGDSDGVMPNLHSDPANNRVNGHLWENAAGTMLPWDTDYSYWGIIFYPYVKERKVFGCAAFRNYGEMLAKQTLYNNVDPKLIYTAAYGINGWLTKENTLRMPRHAEVAVAHDHVEPRFENGNAAGSSDSIFPSSNGINLTHYRQGGGRADYYRGIFRHNIRKNEQ